MDENNRNLILAIVLSVIVLFGWQAMFPPAEEPTPATQSGGDPVAGGILPPSAPGDAAVVPGTAVPGAAVPGSGAASVVDRAAALAQADRRLPIRGSRISGSINLTGGRFDDVTLTDYRDTIEPDAAQISLFSPAGTAAAYFAELGWIDGDGAIHAAGQSAWQTQAAQVIPGRPVTLTLDDPQGLRITRRITIDDNFMFTITDQIENVGDAPITLAPFGRLRRAGKPDERSTYILHLGPVGVLNETLEEVGYDDLEDDGPVRYDDASGWFGITDKFWLTALIPGDGTGPFETNFRYLDAEGGGRYQTDFRGEARVLDPGRTADATVRLFAGAKQAELLTRYGEELGIERFEMAIDFGWFFFLTKPLLNILIVFAAYLGNFGLAILAVTVIIKLFFFPLANRSYKSMSKMKLLQPKVVELREKFGDDKQRMQQEMMALYRREKANPVSGCLPIVLQIPVFFALYKVLFISIEMRHAPFYGWVKDLSAIDPTNIFTAFGLIPWNTPDFMMIGIWPLIMGITMFLQQKLNPAPADPVQAKVFMMMPFIFTVILAGFPAGLVIYWSWNNLLSITQQYVIMRRMGVAVGGGTTKK